MVPQVSKQSKKYLKFDIGVDYEIALKGMDLDFFAVVRNPYDMLYSYYNHRRRIEDGWRDEYSGWAACNDIHSISSFEEFIDKYCDSNYEWHIPIYKEMLFSQLFNAEGKCVVKHIIRYERLAEGLKQLASMYDIEPDLTVNKKNVSLNGKSYKNVYNNEMKGKVLKKCSKELSMFGYSFEGPTDDSIFIDKKLFYRRKNNYGRIRVL